MREMERGERGQRHRPEDDDGSGRNDLLGLGERHSSGLWCGRGGGKSGTHLRHGRLVFIQPEGKGRGGRRGRCAGGAGVISEACPADDRVGVARLARSTHVSRVEALFACSVSVAGEAAKYAVRPQITNEYLVRTSCCTARRLANFTRKALKVEGDLTGDATATTANPPPSHLGPTPTHNDLPWIIAVDNHFATHMF